MPAYDRYWDILVTGGFTYDFGDEIVAACAYQRETKRKNNINRKAFIAVPPQMDKAGAIAAACLNQIRSSEVVFTNWDTLSKVARELSGLLTKKAIKISSANSKKDIDAYTKKLPLFGFKLSTVAPDWEPILLTVAESGLVSFARYPLYANGELVVIYESESARPTIEELERDGTHIGYVSTAHTMDEISQKKISLYTMSLVSWVSGGGLGKIRFNCHGDGEGYLEMVSKGVAHSIPADCLGDWLGANGLTEKRNLKAISLNLCMAAKHFLTPAVLQNGQYSPAEGSAVDLVAKALGSRGVKGVEVTGSNENVAMIDENRFLRLNPEDEIKLRMGLSIEDQKLRVGDNVRMIGVPIGFKFDIGSRTLTIPDGWSIEAKPMSGSQLFAIKCPADSTVEKAASKIVRTHQLATGDFTFKSPGRKDVSFPSQGWILAGKQMISAEGWTVAGATQIRFSGTGGVIQVEGQSGEDGSGVIYERLAKSKAKAVAIS